MQPTSVILAIAFFSAKTFAQAYEEALSTFFQDPAVSSEIAQLPSSAVQLASAIPRLESDFVEYASTLLGSPQFASIAPKLNSILPDAEKSQLANDPASFVLNFIQETAPPAWATAIPLDVVNYIEKVGEDINSIYANDVTIPLPQPSTTLVPRPGSSRSGSVPISSSTSVATSTVKVATSAAFTVTTAPAGTGVLRSSGAGSGSGTGRIVTPTSPSSPSVSPFPQSSASRWSGMVGAVAALMAVGVGALLLA